MTMLPTITAWVRRATLPCDIKLLAVGALIGWLITDIYYLRSLADMKADASDRQKMAELLFRGIESIGEVKYSRDASGKVVGLIIELHGNAGAQSSGTADLSTAPR